ncbi:MAG: hypothetical protein JWM11_2984 [Planctomycetaceae bacterium]|nr:hypothetical protein [Planctomycetaceae bacterium]
MRHSENGPRGLVQSPGPWSMPVCGIIKCKNSSLKDVSQQILSLDPLSPVSNSNRQLRSAP